MAERIDEDAGGCKNFVSIAAAQAGLQSSPLELYVIVRKPDVVADQNSSGKGSAKSSLV